MSSRPALVFVGVVAAAIGGFTGYVVIVGTALVCGGSDAGAPSDSELCKSGRALKLAWLGAGALVAVPLAGLGLSLVRERWAPLMIAIAACFVGFNLWFWNL